jgi:cob(I)alamin adenosyltransferase|nr:hypothetical protein [uncultured Mediterranean phage uvMED]
MNKSEKDNLKLIEYQVQQIINSINKMEISNEKAHTEVKNDLRFIKNNLFDPKEGLWTEVKQNSRFRNNTVKWRSAMGLGVFSLIGKFLYDTFNK